MNSGSPPKLFLWSLAAALAGFLFGFDTVVISGAEQTIQSLWDLTPGMHGFVMASALYGTVLGSVLGAWPTDKKGRKWTLCVIGILYFVSAVWSGFAQGPWSLFIARFIGGLGVGISTVTAPLYISEIAPPERRGRLTGLFQFNIVFGIVVAYCTNAAFKGSGENDWRWMMGAAAFPSVIYTVACLFIPESPRWLMARGREEEARDVLRRITPGASPEEIEATADAIQSASLPEKTSATSNSGGLWSAALRKPVLLAFLIAFFNQLSGINAILYFAPRIFGLTGSENAFAQSIGIGLTNLVFTFVGLWLIDRLGRRTLLYFGSFGYILSLGLCAAAFFAWAPEFKTASAAVDVKSAAADLQKANPARVEKLTHDLAAKKEALGKAGEGRFFPNAAALFPPNATPQESAAVADGVLKEASGRSGVGGLMVLLCVFAFIASHAIGQGAVIWVFIAEIFPDRHRAAGQALGSATHWVFAALLTTVFPLMMAALAPGVVFLFFTGMMVLQLVWVRFMVVETKGIPLEEVQKRLGLGA